MRGTIKSAMVVLCLGAALIFPGCERGDLRVTLSPQEAVDAGAQWAVDGSAWLNSGDMAVDLAAGNHQVTFKPVEGWVAPEAMNAAVAKGELTEAQGLYVPDRGETDPPFPTEALFSNRNAEPLTPGPAAAAAMELPQPALVAELLSWHVPGGEKDGGAAAGGTVSIRAVASGMVYGPWPAKPQPSKDGEPVAWRATPNIPLDAGAYEVLDSVPESWAWNTASGGAGFVDVSGVWYAGLGGLDIGAEGGVGTVGELGISVPPGSFPEGVSLNLSLTGEDVAGTEAAGYLLSGLPDSHGPFTVSLPLPDEVPENPMVQVRNEVLIASAGRVTYGTNAFPAEVREGRLVFEYPGVGGDGEEKWAKQGGGHRWAVVVIPAGIETFTETYLLSSGGHFRLDGNSPDLYPIRDKVEALASALESAFTTLIPGMGMTFFRRDMPITVSLGYWWNDDNFAYGVRGSGGDYMEFNLNKLVDPALSGEINATAVHELFHLLQYQYAVNHAMGGPGGWLYEMFSVWSEWLVSPADHYPDILAGNVYRFTLNGLLKAQETAALNNMGGASPLYHGYVSSLFLRYMILKGAFGLDGVGRFWEGIKAGQGPFDAFKEAANGDWTPYWTRFCCDMFTGQLVSWNLLNLSVGAIVEGVPRFRSGTLWSVPDSLTAANGHDFSLDIPPLSGQLFQVEVLQPLGDDVKSIFQVDVDGEWPKCSVKAYYFNYRRMNSAVYLGEFAPEGKLGGGMVVSVPDEAVPVYRILLVVTSQEPEQSLAGRTLHCKFGPCPSSLLLRAQNAVKLEVGGVNGTTHIQSLRTHYYVPDGTTEIIEDSTGEVPFFESSFPQYPMPPGSSHKLVWGGSSFSYTGTYSVSESSPTGSIEENIVLRCSGHTDSTRCNVLSVEQTLTALKNESYVSDDATWSSQTTVVESMKFENLPSFGGMEYGHDGPCMTLYDYELDGESVEITNNGNSRTTSKTKHWATLADITDNSVRVSFVKK